jgi:hypothetical protein
MRNELNQEPIDAMLGTARSGAGADAGQADAGQTKKPSRTVGCAGGHEGRARGSGVIYVGGSFLGAKVYVTSADRMT